MFIEEFFLNLTVLISFIFLYHQIYRSKFVTTSTRNSHLFSHRGILLGIAGGLLGIVLMHFSIQVDGNTIIDLRVIPLMLVALYGGWIATTITGASIIFFRFLIGVNLSSLSNLLLVIFSALIFLFFASRMKNRWLSIITMLVLSNTVFSFITYALIADFKVYLTINVAYWLITITAGILAISMNNHLLQSNRLFKEYEMNAFIDPLTGLNNVRSFDRAFNGAKQRIVKKQENLSILVIDIDHFKQVNDTYGHPQGDLILKHVATLIKDSCRSVDTVSRNGGEEFTVLVTDLSHVSVSQIAEKIRKNVSEYTFSINNDTLHINITISIGVATYLVNTGDVDDLYRNADAALYKAKNSGRNMVCSYSDIDKDGSNYIKLE
ncbi:diguanylate cyclase [Paraliobacillus zengyii]|uniref:diguanylate cyclase n=1 Tax=Paraliobacillus zengyii TaxID=2213194 RepID=UPI0013A69AA4|nr:diguanylate cyclase [Paraliobacillus zengyii]